MLPDGYELTACQVSGAELDLGRAEADRLLATSRAKGGVRNVLARSAFFHDLANDRLARLAQAALGKKAWPVKGTLFDKTPAANWKVPWHQDLTIAVRERIEVRAFGPWSMKGGVVHVQPPVEVLARMVAVRLHFDAATAENGALRVIPGSHRLGRLSEAGILSLTASREALTCPVEAGAAMLMSPLLVHASSAARAPAHRRVLHVEYACELLPGGLEWVV